jgi:hypothetical protein
MIGLFFAALPTIKVHQLQMGTIVSKLYYGIGRIIEISAFTINVPF